MTSSLAALPKKVTEKDVVSEMGLLAFIRVKFPDVINDHLVSRHHSISCLVTEAPARRAFFFFFFFLAGSPYLALASLETFYID